jgi:hypothetical protein
VVDARLTDENASNIVICSRTVRTQDEKPEMVSNAVITIRDDLGNCTTLIETSEGLYKTDSLNFRGRNGRTYVLSILTEDQEEYESDPCYMWPEQDIDSIYFAKDHELTGGEINQGIRVFIDSKGKSDCRYFRWTYEEYWKIGIPDPRRYEYINDSTIIPRTRVDQICWGYNNSDQILIYSAESGNSNKFILNPILFIDPDQTTRLSIQYFIKVRQLSIAKEEYLFWDQMKKINESGGDIFDKQPFQVFSNIHNTKSDDVQVIGYFQVSSVKQKSMYITADEVKEIGLPQFKYYCNRFEKGLIDYPDTPFMKSTMTFDKIYNQYTGSGFVFVEPLYDKDQKLIRLAFTSPWCADCTLQWSLSKPDFWTDMN